ncbi:hypothetical protein M436DRAFT_77604 [Aureobasidium namibiae CBS 147.97]|uniref:Uncharacterized protein n=1 Tax=Aureobasidium namibiae CBS 147.97 TaxID=1043004 RepID=A0A074WX35_9PEZI
MARIMQTARKNTAKSAPGNLETRSLHRTGFKSKQEAAATKLPLKLNNILQLARPRWPANDEVTPEISLRKIRQLESGNVDEKLMACFARHIIKPGQHNRARCWVSRRSLRKAFPEHFGQAGFLAESTWQHKAASDFGLPDIFFRCVDDRRALLGPHKSVEHMIADIGYAPDLKALSHNEYQWLQQRDSNDEQDSSTNLEQSSTPVRLDVHNEISLDAKNVGENITQLPEHLQPMPSVGSHPRRNTKAPAISKITPSRDLTLPIKAEPMESLRHEHGTSSHQPKLSTPRTTGTQGDNTHTTTQHNTQGQQEQVGTITEPAQLPGPSGANNMTAVKTILIPRLCDILQDFPTAPNDELFLPLLHQSHGRKSARYHRGEVPRSVYSRGHSLHQQFGY